MSKWLRLSEVADLLGLPQQDLRERRRVVRRMLRRLEQRDGVKYLHRDTKGGWLYVSVAKLEELLPWEPGTLSGIRRDMTTVNGQIRELTRRTNGHGARIRKLEKFRKATEAFVSAIRDI
jgi:hypothetical protein